jgi:hypothetical protein
VVGLVRVARAASSFQGRRESVPGGSDESIHAFDSPETNFRRVRRCGGSDFDEELETKLAHYRSSCAIGVEGSVGTSASTLTLARTLVE